MRKNVCIYSLIRDFTLLNVLTMASFRQDVIVQRGVLLDNSSIIITDITQYNDNNNLSRWCF